MHHAVLGTHAESRSPHLFERRGMDMRIAIPSGLQLPAICQAKLYRKRDERSRIGARPVDKSTDRNLNLASLLGIHGFGQEQLLERLTVVRFLTPGRRRTKKGE